MTGIVVATNMEKTAVVLIERLKKHNSYGKYIRRNSKYLVHDPQNRCQTGDKVRIIESKPISKKKRWQVIEIIEKGELGELENTSEESMEQVK